jgi:putative N-acetyltransferase (TIGR04045 family)
MAVLVGTGVTGRRAIECAPATTAEALALHHRIRHQVFVEEQGLFDPSDLDHHDGEPEVIRVLGLCESVPAGTVRLFPLSGDRWQGDRLAVLPRFRALGVGKPLVRFGVATAAALGGGEMVAHIQLANVAFFEQIGWSKAGQVEIYVGVPHQPMSIGLNPT